MIEVLGVYQDVALDNVNEHENGSLSYGMFNRISRRAELRLIDFLTGDVEGIKPPFEDFSQKQRDWIAPFIEKYKVNVGSDGEVPRPKDYYKWDNAFLLGDRKVSESCDPDDKNEPTDGCSTRVELMSGQKFYNRCNTFIEDLNPSFDKPIAKMVGKKIELMPRDLGPVVIEYIRLPKFASINGGIDPVYNQPQATSVLDYEWDEFARELLIWFITDTFAIHTREQSLKQTNAMTGKLIRDQKP